MTSNYRKQAAAAGWDAEDHGSGHDLASCWIYCYPMVEDESIPLLGQITEVGLQQLKKPVPDPNLDLAVDLVGHAIDQFETDPDDFDARIELTCALIEYMRHTKTLNAALNKPIHSLHLIIFHWQDIQSNERIIRPMAASHNGPLSPDDIYNIRKKVAKHDLGTEIGAKYPNTKQHRKH